MSVQSVAPSASSPTTVRRTDARKRWLATALHLLIILAIVVGFGALWWVDDLPRRVDEQQTIVIGQTRLVPDSDASVRVVVQDFSAGKPVAGAQVRVSLKPDKGRAVPLFEGRTDDTGSLPVRFHVPADVPTQGKLVVETQSAAGRDQVEQAVTIQREYRLMLSTDKPLYQPGQVIHMRALALSVLDLSPARGATVGFLVQDPKGNKVYRQSVTASEFGVAAADFTLADLVNQGDYKLSVSIGDTVSEKTVEVRPYVLPKFGVVVSTERSYYLPGQRVQGVVQADYFFGKPVASGKVEIVGSVWDVQRTVAVDLRGETDEKGAYAFAFDLPTYFAGSALETGQAQFVLEVTVIDQTDHAEQTSHVLPVAAQPLIIEAVAESGVLKPGVENVVYVLTSYPDGRPALAELTIRVDGGTPAALSSGQYGLSEFTFTPMAGSPPVLDISARDQAGLLARQQVTFEVEQGGDSVLLRADRAAYVIGETMNLVALTSVRYGDVYLDIVKGGQTLSTRSVQVKDGKAEFAVDVSPDLYGTLELHAYKVLLDGTIVRDTRVAVVDAPNDLAVAVTADKETYLPGEMATLDFQASDARNLDTGVKAALGVAIVDESVFALQRQDPGFAKLYFMLEQQLMEPFYQVKGFELPASIPPDQQEMRLTQDQAARAAWAGAPLPAVAKPINSRPIKQEAVYKVQEKGFEGIGRVSAAALILIPVLLWAVALAALWRSGVAKRAFVRLAVVDLFLLIAAGLMLAALVSGRGDLPFGSEGVLLLPLGLLGLGVLALVIYAWVKRDVAAKFLVLLTAAWGALVILLILAADRGSGPDQGLTIAALLAFLLVPGAFILFGQGRWAQARRLVGSICTGVGVLSALPALVLLPALAFATGSFGAASPVDLARQGQNLAGRGVLAVRETVVVEKEVAVPAGKGSTEAGKDEAATAAAPRLRQYFPETLYWAPEVATDDKGFVSLQVPMADSITTWRLTALASSQDGRLGYVTRGIRVFQDFFVDIDLPVALTQGDEISIPVGVFNYLPEPQQVRLVVQPEPWFELLGEGERALTIAPNDIDVVYFPIRVKQFGQQGFQVTAWGQKMSDAIRREVQVTPDGKEIRLTESDWLRENKEVAIDIPAQAVPEASRIEVKIYPGVMAQVIEGLEKILRLPHG